MKNPNRKTNRLTDFDYSQNGAYFITICTKDKKPILSEIHTRVGDDAHIVPQIILKKYGAVVEKYICNVPEIKKYVIMPDHIHFIVYFEKDEKIYNGAMWASPPTRSIINIVRSIKTLTTKEIGESIFQRSYYDHIIRNDADYIEKWNYIDNNPTKWLLNKKSQG